MIIKNKIIKNIAKNIVKKGFNIGTNKSAFVLPNSILGFVKVRRYTMTYINRYIVFNYNEIDDKMQIYLSKIDYFKK